MRHGEALAAALTGWDARSSACGRLIALRQPGTPDSVGVNRRGLLLRSSARFNDWPVRTTRAHAAWWRSHR
jgi:hypothetical protein